MENHFNNILTKLLSRDRMSARSQILLTKKISRLDNYALLITLLRIRYQLFCFCNEYDVISVSSCSEEMFQYLTLSRYHVF